MNHNSGIHISGSAHVTAAAMAAGTNAQATSINHGDYEALRTQLATVLAELRQLAARDGAFSDAVDMGEALDDELRNGIPDTGRFMKLLRSLGAGVQNVGQIAAAVTLFEESVRQLL